MEEQNVEQITEETSPELLERQELEAQIKDVEAKIEEALKEQRILERQLDEEIGETIKITASASDIRDSVSHSIEGTGKQMKEINDYTESLFHILDELTVSYFSLKNISAATKSVTEYTQIYNTKYHFYNELRRIALGYVIGVDSYIIHNENLRLNVEKAVLQNSEYWLSYALSAVMLWVSDEMEAASRAIQRALDLDHNRACIYFLLINLRFNRIDASRMWFLKYLDRFDISLVGEEWQYLLEAYLTDCFGHSQTFKDQVDKEISEIINKVKIINVGYERKTALRFKEYMDVYPHQTKREFTNLSRYCKDYAEMLTLLSNAEKNLILANYFTSIYAYKSDESNKLSIKIENILYNLINSYEDNEYEVFKKIKYYEAIVQAKGDITIAQKNYEYLYENDHKFSFDELLLRWALADKDVFVDSHIRQFALNYLNEAIVNGVNLYQASYQQTEKKTYEIVIDECNIQYENGHDEDAYRVLNKHYSKSLFWYIFDNKLIMIEMMLAVSSLSALAMIPLYFNLYALIAFAVCLVFFTGLALFGILKRAKKFKVRKTKYMKILEDTLHDFSTWYDYYQEEDKKNLVLKATIERFKSEGEITK